MPCAGMAFRTRSYNDVIWEFIGLTDTLVGVGVLAWPRTFPGALRDRGVREGIQMGSLSVSEWPDGGVNNDSAYAESLRGLLSVCTRSRQTAFSRAACSVAA